MPKVRLSGVIEGRNDPNRKTRAKLMYHLFYAGWDIYNGNGDQKVSLNNIQRKIVETDAFVFLPGGTLEDMFKCASILVGYQTNDADLEGKTSVILNSDFTWDPFLDLFRHLHAMGTVREQPGALIEVVEKPKQVIRALEELYQRGPLPKKPEIELDDDFEIKGTAQRPARSVCVFCSASIQKQAYLEDGYALGKMLAEAGLGCVSGAGSTGIMGQVVKGCGEAGGWAGGSNVPHIIRMEGLPRLLSEFWPRPDIYTRMEVMLQRSDAFVIMPGGLGTVQEMLALVVLKQQKSPIMEGKPVVVVNRRDEETGAKFWSPFIRMLNANGAYEYYHVVDSVKDVVPAINGLLKKS